MALSLAPPATGSKQSLQGPFSWLDLDARSFPMTLQEGQGSLQLLRSRSSEGLTSWSWTRNVAEILGIFPLPKPPIIAFQYGGITRGGFCVTFTMPHGYQQCTVISAIKNKAYLGLYIQPTRGGRRAPSGLRQSMPSHNIASCATSDGRPPSVIAGQEAAALPGTL